MQNNCVTKQKLFYVIMRAHKRFRQEVIPIDLSLLAMASNVQWLTLSTLQVGGSPDIYVAIIGLEVVPNHMSEGTLPVY